MKVKTMQVKFRAKDIDTGKWLYGFYVFHMKTLLCCATDKEVEENEEHLMIFDGCCDWNLPMPWYKADIDHKTLGQFTNLRDVDNKDAYAGDIIIDELNRKWVISDAPGGFRVCRIKEYIFTGQNPIMENGLSEPQNAAWFEENCRIIGNIYDNPELFNNEEKEVKYES